MADKAWKAFERRIARAIGGERRGAETRGARGGKSDVIHPVFAAECKLLARPTFGAMLGACYQAEANADAAQMPVAFIKRKNGHDKDTLVIMRLETWRAWNVGESSGSEEEAPEEIAEEAPEEAEEV